MAEGSAAEIKGGALAQRRGESAQVRELGARLERDHRTLLEDEKPVASRLGVKIEEQPSEEQKLATDELAKLARGQLDQDFVKWQIRDHDQDVKLTEQAAQSSNREVSALAAKALLVLREHDKLAREAARSK